MVFHWSVSDSKSSQVSRTLLSILANLSCVVVWMVSTRPVISKFSSPFNNPLVTAAKAAITIGIIVTFMFYSVVSGDSKVHNFTSYLFCFFLAGVVDYYRYMYKSLPTPPHEQDAESVQF